MKIYTCTVLVLLNLPKFGAVADGHSETRVTFDKSQQEFGKMLSSTGTVTFPNVAEIIMWKEIKQSEI